MHARERKRQEGSNTAQGWVYSFPAEGGVVQVEATGPLVPELQEYFWDVVGLQQCEFNPCYHDILDAENIGVDHVSVSRDGSGNPPVDQYSLTGGLRWVPDTMRDTLRLAHAYSASELDDAAAIAEDHFVTTVQDGYSLLNFIIELIELCELNVKMWTKVLKSFTQALTSFFRLLKKTGNYWVAWNFAIKPTISDIVNMLNTIRAAEKKLKWLRKHNHTVVKIRHRTRPKELGSYELSCPIAELYPVIPDPPPVPAPTIPTVFPETAQFILRGSIKDELNQWAHVALEVPDYLLNDWICGIGTISMVMAGLYNPTKVIWEAIPFSWLIDWFSNKRLELLKEKASLSPFPDSKVLGNGYSIKTLFYGTCTLVLGDGSGWEYPGGDFTYLRYRRDTGYPSAGSLGFSLDLSLKQLSILAGIGINYRRGYRRDRSRPRLGR